MPDFKNMPYSAFKSYVRKVHSERARKEEKNNPVTEITQQEDEPTPEQIVEKIKIELPKWKQQISKKASISNYFSRLIRKLEEEFNPNSDKNILDFCMQLVKILNLQTVAEGAESETQTERLKSLGCDYIQGYFQ